MAYRTSGSGRQPRPKPQVIWFASSVVNTPITVDKADLQPTGQAITLSKTWSIAVTAAALQPAPQSIAFKINFSIGKADLQPAPKDITLSKTWSLAVTKADLQPAPQAIVLSKTWSIVVSSTALSIIGQSTGKRIDVGKADLQPAGQDITLTWNMGGIDTPITVDSTALSIVGQDIGLVLSTGVAVAPSGGWIESEWSVDTPNSAMN